jgi:tetratricopeptide (TPR) repeat protein
MEPITGTEDNSSIIMQSAGMIDSSTDDDLIWRDICLASAWFDRAQQLLGNTPTVKTDPEIVIDSAQKALSLYQGCFVRVKTRASIVSAAAAAAAAAVESKPHQPQDPPEMLGVGINLELRIAQTLRLLAAIHAAADDEEDKAGKEEEEEEGDEEKDKFDKHHHFKAAVQYHDDAVSLLVGVFEDEDDNDDGASYSQCQFSTEEGNVIAGDLSWEGARDQFSPQTNHHSISPMTKEALHENDNFTMGGDATAMGEEVDSNNNVLLTIQVSSDEKLLQHTTFTSQPTQVTFLIPAEEQRVRAIAMSLNAMAELHAKQGNDGAAMESFREALEILRAATEEQEETESLSGSERQNGKKSRVEVDLANTLQGVGNFHLRRDELDAAFNAYSTVWALYNGLDDVASSSSQDGVEGSQIMAREPPPTLPDLGRSRLTKKTFASPGALAAMNNLGIVHERRGELEEALSCYDHILRARIESLGSDHFDTANALVNIGNCYQRKLDWEKAVVAYKEATSIYRNVSHRQQQTSKNGLALDKNDVIRLQRSLAGVLRNWGTCCWKQRRIPDAIDLLNQSVNTEENLISDSLELAVSKKIVRQCMESMAQMLGILGCLYVEYNLVEHRSFENSEGAFTMALQIYEELGYENTNPSVVWANSNLAAVRLMGVRSMTPPPPPAPTPPSSKASPKTTKFIQSDEIDFDEIDSVDLDEVLDDGDDSVFSGVDDSTEELDEILSDARHLQEREHPGGKNEEVDFDEAPCGRPLSKEQRNHSGTSLSSEQEHQETLSDREEGDSNEDKEKFLLQQKGSYGDESIEAAEAHLSLAQHLWEKGDRELATEHYTEAHAVFQSRLGDCKEVALILKSLGDLNKEDGKLEAAKELYSEALDIEMSAFGHHRPQTLNAAGVVCLMLDDFRSAMEYHRRALQIQKKKLAAEHKYEMFETLVLIGNVYYSEQNNLSNIRTQGVDYKDFIESGFLGWIANAHDMRGEYGKAIQFYEESLQMAISRSGKESKKETALTLNRLGSLTRELGRYDEVRI